MKISRYSSKSLTYVLKFLKEDSVLLFEYERYFKTANFIV